MGYSTSPRLIIENEELLEELLQQVVKKGTPLKIDGGENVSRKQYQLRRILAACDRHPHVLDGRFSGLGRKITLKIQGTVIHVGSKATVSFALAQPNEMDAIDKLRNYKGTLDVVEFRPSNSFTEEKFASLLAAEGWKLHPSTKEVQTEGRVRYAVEKMAPSTSGFEILREDQGT